MSHGVTTFRSGDNFIYLYQYETGMALVVDPGVSAPVVEQLDRLNLRLGMILATHHHGDHIGGIDELKRTTGCRVVGGDRQRISGIDRVVDDGDIIESGEARIQVLATPGHTRTSMCYYVKPFIGRPGILWTGDTMFVSGCGRLLECDAAMMYSSLMKLAALPDETLVYCGHDYTEENCRFALGMEPGNPALAERLRQVRKAVKAGTLTVPSNMAQERRCNPFLRAAEATIKAGLGMSGVDAVAVFAELRRRKDSFV